MHSLAFILIVQLIFSVIRLLIIGSRAVIFLPDPKHQNTGFEHLGKGNLHILKGVS